MNLLCLSCGGEFTADTDVIGTDGATVKCEHCGIDQPLFVRRRAPDATESGGFRFSQELLSSADRMVSGAPAPTPVTGTAQAVPRPPSGSSTFKKPIGSSWAEMRSSDAATSHSSDGVEAAGDSDDLAEISGSFVVPDLAASMPDFAEEMVAGPFVVRSPMALVFEFPDFQVLDDWSRSVDHPEKYSVQDSSGAEFRLGDFTRVHRAGNQRASAVRNAIKAAGMGTNPTSLQNYSETLKNVELAGGARDGSVNASGQFQFKIEEDKTRDPRKAILAVVLGIAGVGIILGALFLLGVI